MAPKIPNLTLLLGSNNSSATIFTGIEQSNPTAARPSSVSNLLSLDLLATSTFWGC